MSADRYCKNHPARPGTVYCQKYDRYYCDECIHCREPMQYCKFRTACLIWELEKHGWPEEHEGSASTQDVAEKDRQDGSEKASASR